MTGSSKARKAHGRQDEPPVEPCRVCGSGNVEHFATLRERTYWRCRTCEAVFLDAESLPTPDAEMAHYLHHENDPYDPGYRRFLSKLGEPLAARLKPASQGLDYGCGPGPGLAVMLREQGHEVRTYDPFFDPDAAALDQTYNFIICSEVAEHFHRPAGEFKRLDAMLQPGGWLGLMTCFRTEDSRFAGWHYRHDPTHVVFYRQETLQHVASMLGWACTIVAKDVALFQKPPRPTP